MRDPSTIFDKPSENSKFMIGESEFNNLMKFKATFIDKSLFIKEIIDDPSLVKLIIRPPKFGKSLNMSMLYCFFSNLTSEDEKTYFKNLKISSANVKRNNQCQYSEVSAMSHLGQYPVVKLNFKDLALNSFYDFISSFKKIISLAYLSYEKTLFKFINAESSEREFLENITYEKASTVDVVSSLKKLTELLHKIYKRKVIILIDGYDVLDSSFYKNDEQLNIIETIYNFLLMAFKDNEYLMQAVIMGVQTFTEINTVVKLNNVVNYSVFSEKYSTCFGFLEDEVKQLMPTLTNDEIAHINEWYGGYQIGDNIIFNPWSIINFYERTRTDNDFIYNSYWIESIRNDQLSLLLKNSFIENKTIFINLLEKKLVTEEIKASISLADTNKTISKRELLFLLICNGYLSATIHNVDSQNKIYRLWIPNIEVLNFYKEALTNINENETSFIWLPYNINHSQSIEKLPDMWNVPSRNINFTGREELLKKMAELFNVRESKHLVLTAHGLGGIGKTQLTLEYVWRNYKNYKGVCWFNAENKERLIIDYVSLGQTLHLFAESEKSISLEEKAKIVKTWLEHSNRAGWLLIYDSALKQDDINNLLPVKTGKILITSRHTYWPDYQILEVKVFTLKEAQDYIKKILGQNKFNEETANQLINLLGYLPLAIAQACAYIQRNEISIADYLDLYHKKHEMLLNEQLLPQDKYQKAVAVTWNITLDQMTKETPESVKLMYCCSHLYHEQIPESLVPYFFEGADETELKLKVKAAKRVAKEYSMINCDDQKQTFSMHSLVQQIIKDQVLKKNKDIGYLLKGVKALIAIYPGGKESMIDYALRKELKTHLEQTLQHLDNYLKKLSTNTNQQTQRLIAEIEKNYLLKLLICLADVYQVFGNALKEKDFLERALKIQVTFYAKDYLQIAKIQGNLANSYSALGNMHKAKELLENVLKIIELCCGRYHLDYVGTLVNLGNAYGDIGNTHKKKELCEQALTIMSKFKNQDPLRIATIFVNLGIAYGALGDARKQKELCEQALMIEEKYYGKEHIKVASVLENLGNAYGDLGDVQKQKELCERVLKIKETHYGKNHVTVAITLTNLGNANSALGDIHKSKELLERALAIKEAYYGRNHIEVAITLANLANAYDGLGEFYKQKELLERALKIKETHYGKGHIKVAKILASLGSAYGTLGDTLKSKELLEEALVRVEKFYGKDHIEVGKILTNFSNVYYVFGEVYKQRELLERALKIEEKYYGKEYPGNTVILCNLADNYGMQGDAKKQKELLEKALAIDAKHYSRNHPHIATTLTSLSSAYGALGNMHKMEELLKEALTIMEGYYGKNHIKVASLLIYSGNVYGNLGNTSRQKELLERALKIEETYYGKNHIQVAKTLNNLSCAYRALGDLSRQKELLERSLAIIETFYSTNYYVLSGTLTNLGALYHILGNNIKAKAMLERAIEINKSNYTKNDVEIAKIKVNLANIHGALGDARKQKELCEYGLKVFEKQYGRNHVKTAIVLLNLGKAHGALGDVLKQKELCEEALKIKETKYGTNHVELVNALITLGNAYSALREGIRAKELLERALSIQELNYGKEHFELAKTLINLGLNYLQQENLIQAKHLVERAYYICVKYPNIGENHPYAQNAKQILDGINQKLLISKNKEIISLEFLKPSLLDLFKKQIETNPKDWQGWLRLADYHYNQANLEEAIQCYVTVINLSSENSSAHHNLGCLYHVQNKIDLAEPYFKQALNIKASAAIYCDYGLFLLKKKHYEEAVQKFLAALSLRNDSSNLIYGKIEKVLFDKYLQQEITDKSNLEIKPFLIVHYWLVQCFHFLRDDYLKQFYLSKLVNFAEKSSTALHYRILSYAYLITGNKEKAEACKALAISMEDMKVKQLQGANFNELYLNELTKLIEKSPTALRYSVLSYVYFSISNEEKAQECYAIALSLEPTDKPAPNPNISQSTAEPPKGYNPTFFTKSETGTLATKALIEKKQTISSLPIIN